MPYDFFDAFPLTPYANAMDWVGPRVGVLGIEFDGSLDNGQDLLDDTLVSSSVLGVQSLAQFATTNSAFPFTRYGTVAGEVVDVSRDANKDDKLGLIYPVQVRLDTTYITTDSKRVDIAPGMSTNAEIITGDRRVIEYLLPPPVAVSA